MSKLFIKVVSERLMLVLKTASILHFRVLRFAVVSVVILKMLILVSAVVVNSSDFSNTHCIDRSLDPLGLFVSGPSASVRSKACLDNECRSDRCDLNPYQPKVDYYCSDQGIELGSSQMIKDGSCEAYGCLNGKCLSKANYCKNFYDPAITKHPLAGRWIIYDADTGGLTTSDILSMQKAVGGSVYFFKNVRRQDASGNPTALDLRELKKNGIITVATLDGNELDPPWFRTPGYLEGWLTTVLSNPLIDGIAFDSELSVPRQEALAYLSLIYSRAEAHHKFFVTLPNGKTTSVNPNTHLGASDYARYSHIIMPWTYNLNQSEDYADSVYEMWASWSAAVKAYPTVDVIPLFDFGRYVGSDQAVKIPNFLSKRGVPSVGLFNSHIAWLCRDGVDCSQDKRIRPTQVPTPSQAADYLSLFLKLKQTYTSTRSIPCSPSGTWPAYDFGGAYGYGYPQNFPNVATGDMSCPPNFITSRVLAGYGEDFELNFCYRPLPVGDAPLYDFGGIYGAAYGVSYSNPLTGQESCPAGYQPTRIFGTYGLDWHSFVCLRPHRINEIPQMLFGGMYSETPGANYINPITNGFSCPEGYTKQKFRGNQSPIDHPAYYCYKLP